jgi:hypothetical protein
MIVVYVKYKYKNLFIILRVLIIRKFPINLSKYLPYPIYTNQLAYKDNIDA